MYSHNSVPRIVFRQLGVLFLLLTVLVGAPVIAQEYDETMQWIFGPDMGPLGDIAAIDIPEDYQFVNGDGTRRILEWLENPTSGSELGLIMPVPRDSTSLPWFVVFEFDPVGYVPDDEQGDLDADVLLSNMMEGTEAGNKIRAERGWGEIHVLGWEVEPYYDPDTQNLRWAVRIGSEYGESINFSTRLLGRRGVMNADLVVDPAQFAESMAGYDELIAGFGFTVGHDYSSFSKGDKVAKYGLTALIAGGAGAVAMKTGLLARFWKFIVLGVVAAFGFVKRFFGSLFGRKPESPAETPPDE